jgi:hypothetical protein
LHWLFRFSARTTVPMLALPGSCAGAGYGKPYPLPSLPAGRWVRIAFHLHLQSCSRQCGIATPAQVSSLLQNFGHMALPVIGTGAIWFAFRALAFTGPLLLYFVAMEQSTECRNHYPQCPLNEAPQTSITMQHCHSKFPPMRSTVRWITTTKHDGRSIWSINPTNILCQVTMACHVLSIGPEAQ